VEEFDKVWKPSNTASNSAVMRVGSFMNGILATLNVSNDDDDINSYVDLSCMFIACSSKKCKYTINLATLLGYPH